VLLYRITYRSALDAHSVVRPLVAPPTAGDQIALDARTVVTIRKIVPHPEGDTIAAELIAEEEDASPAVHAEPSPRLP
jgi:hypothetical protein